MATKTETDLVAIEPFAERVLGRRLWDHQMEVARSQARYRVICAGRQVGKSALLSVLALHEAATRRNILVMLVSAGEVASRRLLEECTVLATRSPLLTGSVADDNKQMLTLSNGSRILSVPASEKQIRGWSVDLLIADEAAFIDEAVWSAAEPAIIARPGSRVILTSTPFGTDHFFRRLWQRGIDHPDETYESWHWPSSVSPLITEKTLEEIRSHENPITFAREYEAVWAEESGLLLTPDELQGNVLDYDLTPPSMAPQVHWHDVPGSAGRMLPPQVVAGVDYGLAYDASALVLLGALDDYGVNVDIDDLRNARTTTDHVFFIPWLEYHHRMTYEAFANRVVDVGKSYNISILASESNGVGAGAGELMALAHARAEERGELCSKYQISGWGTAGTYVAPVWTDARRKQAQFGRIKGMLQKGTLVLPRHPELLKQLASLEMTETASGSLKISVPERFGHDDIAMALAQAVMTLGTFSMDWSQRFRHPGEGVRFVDMASGMRVPERPLLLHASNRYVFNLARGAEREMPI